MYFGIDPSVVLQMAEGPATYEQAPAGAPPANDPQARFVAKVLGETEDTWGAIFTQSLNRNYVPPKLVLFRGATPTAAAPARPPWARSTAPATARCTSTSASLTKWSAA
ncbi:Predicted metalloprotease [Bordetella pertussis]|nr:neutral zinc metallopeptidase [Bordetella pertussis]SUW81215.1 Predicted metalloprotease [Bordetella pertussis]